MCELYGWAPLNKGLYSDAHFNINLKNGQKSDYEYAIERRSKCEKANYLRVDFSKTGKVTIYATFPKEMGLKGRKLGTCP